jgi:hypothetical protein
MRHMVDIMMNGRTLETAPKVPVKDIPKEEIKEAPKKFEKEKR